MWFGVICGFCAALCNTAGYFFSARFLKHSPSPLRLLISAQVVMMVIAAPFIAFLYPAGGMGNLVRFAWITAAWIVFFWLGQFGFFTTQKHIEASRLASLLGLKIIILAFIYIAVEGNIPSVWQWFAIVLATVAAVMMNWSRAGRITAVGALILLLTLVSYSCCDICETEMVLLLKGDGHILRSAFFTTALAYTALGLVSLPAAFALRINRRELSLSAPYAALWLVSQVLLMVCFGLVKPVFGNVILASRGFFSVIVGAALSFFGLRGLDADIPARQWVRRAIAALLMIAAIAIYSRAVA